MKKHTGVAVFVTVGLMLSSCASLVNRDTTTVNVYTRQKDVKVSFDDTSRFVYSPASIVVKRSNEPLFLTLRKDSISKNIYLKSKLNTAFLYGNIINFTFGLGHLIDLTNNRRYSYPKNVYVDLDNRNLIDYTYKTKGVPIRSLSQNFNEPVPGRKGSIGIKLSIPEGNSFFLNKETQMGNIFGFLGLTTELDYRYATGKFFGVGGGYLLSFGLPVPAPVDYDGEYDLANGFYLDVLHGHKLKDLTFSYGLSYEKLMYEKRTTEGDFTFYDQLFYREENRLGLSLSAAYNITNGIAVGVKYLPSFYTLQENEFRYGHMLFLDLALNFNIGGKK